MSLYLMLQQLPGVRLPEVRTAEQQLMVLLRSAHDLHCCTAAPPCYCAVDLTKASIDGHHAL